MNRSSLLSQPVLVLTISVLLSAFVLATVIWVVLDNPSQAPAIAEQQQPSDSSSSASEVAGETSADWGGAIRADEQRQSLTNEDLERMKTMTYAKEWDLQAVSGGGAAGRARVDFGEKGFQLRVTFDGLADPDEGAFYEGWLIRPEPVEAISTGKVGKIDGAYTDVYRSLEDLTGYTRYALTLETNDNPTPDRLVVDGKL